MICVLCLVLAVISCTWVYVFFSVIISVFNMLNVLCSDVECGFIKPKDETVHTTYLKYSPVINIAITMQ